MHIRSSGNTAPRLEHQGTTPVWWLVDVREFRERTIGGHLELISEFEVPAGGAVHPHSHPTYEFYYMLTGKAVMTVAGESAEVGPGDLIMIPPDEVHSIHPASPHTGIRALAIGFAVKDAPEIDYTDDTTSH